MAITAFIPESPKAWQILHFFIVIVPCAALVAALTHLNIGVPRVFRFGGFAHRPSDQPTRELVHQDCNFSWN
jgi:hypothetical protein